MKKSICLVLALFAMANLAGCWYGIGSVAGGMVDILVNQPANQAKNKHVSYEEHQADVNRQKALDMLSEGATYPVPVGGYTTSAVPTTK